MMSSCGRLLDPCIKMGELSLKQFQVPIGQVVPATEWAKLLHNVREPMKSVEIIPAMKKDTLFSVHKFADAGCVTVFDDKKVNISGGLMANLKIREDAIIKGWRDLAMGLYWIPLQNKVENLNMGTVF